MAVNRPKIHFETVEELLGAPVIKDGTQFVKIKDIFPFKDHPFKVLDDARMDTFFLLRYLYFTICIAIMKFDIIKRNFI